MGIALVLLVAACGGGAASPSPSDPTPTLTPAPSAPPPTSTPEPTPTPVPSPVALAWDALPALQASLVDVTAICDPSPGLQFPDAGDSLIACSDGLDVGIRAIETATDLPIARAYLQLPRCDVAPCTLEERSTGSVTAWTQAGAWTTNLDAVARSATLPRPDAATSWPTLEAPVPAIERPDLGPSPDEVATREPAPFCGRFEFETPEDVPICFLAAVLAGRPAEAVEAVYGTEGGQTIVLWRFSGTGSVAYYSRGIDANAVVGGWYAQRASVSMGVEPAWWSAEPIDGTYRELP